MEILFILFFLIIFILLSSKNESYGSLPDLSMGYQWGSSPENLYRSSEETQNYFADDLRKSLEIAEYMDTKYARGPGFGIGDIRKQLNTGLHQKQKISYR